MPVGLLGKKLGQTRVYDPKGVITPVTIVLAGPNRVLQCKTEPTDGYNAVQLGFNDQKEQRLTKPLLGHIKKFNGIAVKRIEDVCASLERNGFTAETPLETRQIEGVGYPLKVTFYRDPEGNRVEILEHLTGG